jgi:hypothetical protein
LTAADDEIGWRLKSEGLDFMLDKTTSDFPDIFSSAFTSIEIREIDPGWQPREDMRDWLHDRESAVFLETNIWKNIGMLMDQSSADTLVIKLDGNTIVDYRFFANLGY